MKDKISIRDGWFWPKIDENSWKYQNEFNDLVHKVMPYVENTRCMIQAGGNCGYILKTFVHHFETVYTFEPDPVNFYCLTNNVLDERVVKIQACLGNKREQVSTKQLVRENRPNDTGGVHVAGSGYTPTVIIDDLNLGCCDLIQLDVEGYELQALLGARETISKHKPVLCIEFCEKWLNRYDNSSDELLKYLGDLGYTEVDNYGVDKIFVCKNK